MIYKCWWSKDYQGDPNSFHVVALSDIPRRWRRTAENMQKYTEYLENMSEDDPLLSFQEWVRSLTTYRET